MRHVTQHASTETGTYEMLKADFISELSLEKTIDRRSEQKMSADRNYGTQDI